MLQKTPSRKKKPTIYANQISDKDLVSRIYEELLKLKKTTKKPEKKQTPQFKNGQRI